MKEDILNTINNEEEGEVENFENQKRASNALEKFFWKKRCSCYLGDTMLGITIVGRIILTLYTFHGLFFVYNIIFQYVILFAGVLYDLNNMFFKIIMALIYILFSLSAGNILVIPTYEFLTFPFMTFRNPFVHLLSFAYIIRNKRYKFEKALKQSNQTVNIFLIIVEVFYVLGFLCVWASITTVIKDWCKMFILIFIYTYYLLIIISYAATLIYIMIRLLISSYREYMEVNEGVKEFFLVKYVRILLQSVNDFNLFFHNREEIPEINLLSYVINPYLKKNYEFADGTVMDKKYLEDYCDNCGIYQKIILFFSTIIVFLILLSNNSSDENFFAVLFFIFLFVVMSILSIGINFPFCFRNKKTAGDYFFDRRCKYKVKIRHPIMIPLIRFICNILVILICIGLVGIFFFKDDEESTPSNLENISGKEIESFTSLTENKFLPNVCFSTFHFLPIPYFLPFIIDAYYFDKNYSTLNNINYKNLFFSKNIKIDVYDNLIEKEEDEDDDEGSVKMIQYNVKGEGSEITILSIKGTSYKKDIFLDLQLYFPSVLLSILKTFSLSQDDTNSNKLIEYSLSIPYRIFFQFLIIDKYINKLRKAYMKNTHNFYQNVVIVGHSLGGGLAKILGRFLKKQSISLSGPGMNAFNSLWKYEGDSEDFEISIVDLVPDMDLVPRVEVSGGTIFRILCINGVFGCHEKERSLCELLIMCRHPNYYEYCTKIAGVEEDEITELYENSELNDN